MKNLKKVLLISGLSLLILNCKDEKKHAEENHQNETPVKDNKELAMNTTEARPHYTLEETIYVDRLPNDDYKLTLKKDGNWNVYKGVSVEEIKWENPTTLSVNNNEITVKNETPTKRLFFAAVKGKDTLYLSEREIDLEHAINFRDLGGIPTTNEKHTKWGMLYRSGEIAELTPEDLAYIKSLKLKTILDLRTNDEIKAKPDMYPDGVNWKHLPIGNLDKNGSMKKMMEIFSKADPETFNADEIMIVTSNKFIENPENFKKMFAVLLDENQQTPLLFHCTAGKDRTGFSSAFILRALGVDKETAINEYLLSNYFRYNGNNEALAKHSSKKYGIDPRIMKQMMEVRKAWIEAGFDAIDEKYGSFDNFLVEGLALTTDKQAKLKSIFLQ